MGYKKRLEVENYSLKGRPDLYTQFGSDPLFPTVRVLLTKTSLHQTLFLIEENLLVSFSLRINESQPLYEFSYNLNLRVNSSRLTKLR